MDQQRQADADRASVYIDESKLSGLPALHALQFMLWGWCDARGRSKREHYSQSQPKYSPSEIAAVARAFLQQAAATEKGETMVTKNDIFPSRFFKAADLKESIVLTVMKAPVEELKYQNRTQQKVVLYFREVKQVFPLNVTNFDLMTKATGKSDSDEWTGCKIELYRTETEMRGEVVDCIRIRAPGGSGKRKTKASSPTDETIPFDA
jgi:hypothetical protein